VKAIQNTFLIIVEAC